jgi:glutamate racemase
VFDSGVGGLTVVRHILERLPAERVVYLGDTANVPYGGRSPRELVYLGRTIIDFLVGQGAKVVVAACNTSSSVSLPLLRECYPVTLLDVISPGACDAVQATRNKRVGVLATQTTVSSRAYTRHIQALDPAVSVFEVPCPQFVPLVEAGLLDGVEVEAIAASYVRPLLRRDIDTLVLGCTHYPFLAPVLKRLVGEEVTLVDPAEGTVRRLQQVLAEQNIASERASVQAPHRFYATGATDSFYKVGGMVAGICTECIQRVNLFEGVANG